MNEDARYQESCESLRYCEDFIGQPRDFPKKNTVIIPAPEAKPYSYEETWQHEHAERVAEYRETVREYRCSNCIYDNGTTRCKKMIKDRKLSHPAYLTPEYNPNNSCFDWESNCIKLRSDARRA